MQFSELTERKLEFFDTNYEMIANYDLLDNRIDLGDRNLKTCRFCGKKAPEVTFRKEAHAIPECFGNKKLYTFYECDTCNNQFSMTLENHFANYLGVGRTISLIKGKRGIPVYKSNKSRIEIKEGKYIFENHSDDSIIEVDEEKKIILINTVRDPYVPVAVHKCLTKMALSILPENELHHFVNTLAWVNEVDHKSSNYDFNPLIALGSFTPGINPFVYIKTFLLKRKNDNDNLPYMIYVIFSSNYFFQIFLPFCEKDRLKSNLHFEYFPQPFEEKLHQIDIIDFSSKELVRNEKITATLSYDEVFDEE